MSGSIPLHKIDSNPSLADDETASYGDVFKDDPLRDSYSDEEDTLVYAEAPRETKTKPRRKSLNLLKWTFVTFGLVWMAWFMIYALRGYWKPSVSQTLLKTDPNKRVTLADVDTSRLSPRSHRVDWTDSFGDDGFFLTKDGNDILLKHVDGSTKVLVTARDIRTPDGNSTLSYQDYFISADTKFIIFTTDTKSIWRKSFVAHWWIYDIEKKITSPLVETNSSAIVAVAVWSKTGHDISYVLDNDLYIRKSLGPSVRITFDSSSEIFNGAPDWVYEEEVLYSNTAMWWSPTSSHLVFFRLDDKSVPTFTVQHFQTSEPQNLAPQYPNNYDIKYPKPGFPNPDAEIWIYDIQNMKGPEKLVWDAFQENVLAQVTWVSNSHILLRETDRAAENLRNVLFDVQGKKGNIVQQVDVLGLDGGWAEMSHDIIRVPADPKRNRPEDGYISLVIHQGNNHLAYYTPLNASESTLLTSGNFEVVDGVAALDLDKNQVYYISTEKSAIERHLYSVDLSGSNNKNWTDVSQDGYYSVNFSPRAGYYLLTCEGPGLPYQKVLSTSNSEFELVIETNELLEKNLQKFDLPQEIYSTIEVDGYTLNVKEIRPPNFDESGETKYPVLFNPYGGPVSQSVDKKFGLNWHTWLASEPSKEYIIVTVDGRGTGYMGRRTRVSVRGQLGTCEAKDQVEAAKIWRERIYVDSERIAIWGWSFGGFLTLKALELGSGVFKYGIAVAPVTDWRFYDSIYTERYMGLLSENQSGYATSAVTKVDGFRAANRFMVIHGSGDDNVHYQNTLFVVDELTFAGISNYDMQVFPDSDHSINFHKAHFAVYTRITEWLEHAFGVKGKETNGVWVDQLWA
ncbi:putative dipeptidyl-aminopeptidase B [Neolecta irregularis DAH-3]|uniref:Putative dipeptidyl-aminopeptidase B n=1 Tax=Neolecta irregularis (strain DAH-3) TaxID=1198029 RepID=A0A1U7LR14_NEOID|nr:putative dipeptidyl-aminopeptidase B [Neolecta irregularis DAH-3]|eukprot:OLL25097.1 putative dipeptidyl-aminopeptidase B [Neolecta irregularis DAH-3]